MENQKSVSVKKTDKSHEIPLNPLKLYTSEITKYQLLTRDQEKELARRVQEDEDMDALQVLITANLRLVVKIAISYYRVYKIGSLLDLIQEGNMGLICAVKKFDPEKNVKLSTYSSFWIKAYMKRFIMHNRNIIKLGTTSIQRKLYFNLKKQKQELINMGLDPLPERISQRMGIPEMEIVRIDALLTSPDVSLNSNIAEDNNAQRIDLMPTPEPALDEKVSEKETAFLLKNKIIAFKNKLNQRELDIFESRIYSDEPVTLQQIGDRYGISKERIRQIEGAIIKKAKKFFQDDRYLMAS